MSHNNYKIESGLVQLIYVLEGLYGFIGRTNMLIESLGSCLKVNVNIKDANQLIRPRACRCSSSFDHALSK